MSQFQNGSGKKYGFFDSPHFLLRRGALNGDSDGNNEKHATPLQMPTFWKTVENNRINSFWSGFLPSSRDLLKLLILTVFYPFDSVNFNSLSFRACWRVLNIPTGLLIGQSDPFEPLSGPFKPLDNPNESLRNQYEHSGANINTLGAHMSPWVAHINPWFASISPQIAHIITEWPIWTSGGPYKLPGSPYDTPSGPYKPWGGPNKLPGSSYDHRVIYINSQVTHINRWVAHTNHQVAHINLHWAPSNSSWLTAYRTHDLT